MSTYVYVQLPVSRAENVRNVLQLLHQQTLLDPMPQWLDWAGTEVGERN